MDSVLFLKLISNLLNVSVFDATDMDSTLSVFEDKFCFDKTLQPMFAADALHYLLRSASDSILYEVVDSINLSITFFSYEGRKYIIGPYAKSEYSEHKIEAVLMENSILGISTPALRLYYTSLPVLYTDRIRFITNACVSALTDTETDFEYRRLSGFIAEKAPDNSDENPTDKNYSEVYRRYDAENHFLSLIRLGDVENVSAAYKHMSRPENNENMTKEILSYYSSPTSIGILRALVRKAAEESGLSVITIDTITQKYAQKMSGFTRSDKQNSYLGDMIKELTMAVRNHRLSMDTYSAPVRKAMEYVELHLGREISVNDLSEAADLSVSHLSRVFKNETGETLSGYIALSRCKKAAQLLKETKLAIQDISSFVGYHDNNYFVKVFKKIYKITPSEYRQK